MKTRDLLQETITALRANKARSGLTILGIVIGIASVIAMVSIGQGAQNSIQSSIEGLGANLLTIMPGVVEPGRGFVSSGRGAAQTLERSDAEAIGKVAGVALVSPEIQRRFQISAPTGNNTNTTVIGGTADYAATHNLVVTDGSFISEGQERNLARVAVLGPTTASDLFAEVEPVGQTIRVNQSILKVIGVLEAKGATGFFNPDDVIIVPLTTMEKVLAGDDKLSTIAVSVANKDEMSTVEAEIDALITRRHRVAEPDFSIFSQADILGTLTQVTTTFTLFLASIAGISLLVGGIGIMNMMLTAVTERTREIGLRKAIGARERDIANQFLAEAILLTLIGGVIGVALGALGAWGVSQLAHIAVKVSLLAVFLAFGVSAAIGLIFGYYPARRAAKLNPIEALRYE